MLADNISSPAHSGVRASYSRRQAGLRLVADWQAEYGAFSTEEIAAARAEMAKADAEALATNDRWETDAQVRNLSVTPGQRR